MTKSPEDLGRELEVAPDAACGWWRLLSSGAFLLLRVGWGQGHPDAVFGDIIPRNDVILGKVSENLKGHSNYVFCCNFFPSQLLSSTRLRRSV